MRFKVTIAYTIVISALFVIALIVEGEPTNSSQEAEVVVDQTNQYDQFVSSEYYGYSSIYAYDYPYTVFTLQKIE